MIHICKEAALIGSLGILKWASEHGFVWNSGICRNAAGEAHLEILKWARENGCPE